MDRPKEEFPIPRRGGPYLRLISGNAVSCGRASRVSAEGPLWGFSPGGKLRLIVRTVAAAVFFGFGSLALPALVIARFRDGPKAAFVVARLDGDDGGIPGGAGAPGPGTEGAAGLGHGRAGVGRTRRSAVLTVPIVTRRWRWRR